MHATCLTLTPIGYQDPAAVYLNNHDIVHYGTHTNIWVNTKDPSSELTLRDVAKSLRILPETDSRVAQWVAVIRALQDQLLGAGVSHDYLEPFRIIRTIQSGTPLPAIATSWYENRDILHYIRRNPEMDKSILIYQVICAMSYLHARGIVHGNIYPGNILITDQGTARVADVGFNILITQHMCGGFLPVPATWMYKAPEELLDGHRTMQTDVYALGSTIYTIYASQPPYQPASFGNVRGIREITAKGHRQVFEHSQPTGMSDSAWEMVRRCWEYEAQQRPSMKEIEVVFQQLLSRV